MKDVIDFHFILYPYDLALSFYQFYRCLPSCASPTRSVSVTTASTARATRPSNVPHWAGQRPDPVPLDSASAAQVNRLSN
jgi:hypothetical protein